MAMVATALPFASTSMSLAAPLTSSFYVSSFSASKVGVSSLRCEHWCCSFLFFFTQHCHERERGRGEQREREREERERDTMMIMIGFRVFRV
jgi:hypothetical protein